MKTEDTIYVAVGAAAIVAIIAIFAEVAISKRHNELIEEACLGTHPNQTACAALIGDKP